MSKSLPTVEAVLDAIDAIAEKSPDACKQMGAEIMVPWRLLAYALFPRTSPAWRRAPDMRAPPSAAVQFMNDLGKDRRIRAQYAGGHTYYGRRVHL